jgi:hypothetical protein
MTQLTTKKVIEIRLESLKKKELLPQPKVGNRPFDPSDFEVTRHAFKRAKKRLGWGKKSLKRMMPKVLENGLSEKDFTGAFKKYLRSKFLRKGTANHLLIYGEVIYFMRDATLITLYRVPSEYLRCLPPTPPLPPGQVMAQAA